MSQLTLEQVRTLLDSALAVSAERGLNSSVVVVDSGGHVRGSMRPPLGRFINIDSAEKKAWTAAAFQRPTEMVRTIALPNLTNNAYGLQHTDPRICIVTGGIPIIDRHGTFLGAIGVAAWRGKQALGSTAITALTAMTLLFTFNKWAFANYYFTLLSLAALAAAASFSADVQPLELKRKPLSQPT